MRTLIKIREIKKSCQRTGKISDKTKKYLLELTLDEYKYYLIYEGNIERRKRLVKLFDYLDRIYHILTLEPKVDIAFITILEEFYGELEQMGLETLPTDVQMKVERLKLREGLV